MIPFKFTVEWRSSTGTKLAAAPELSARLSYLPEFIQAIIQKSSFAYGTLSWIGIRRRRWLSGKEVTKVNTMAKVFVFKGLIFH